MVFKPGCVSVSFGQLVKKCMLIHCHTQTYGARLSMGVPGHVAFSCIKLGHIVSLLVFLRFGGTILTTPSGPEGSLCMASWSQGPLAPRLSCRESNCLSRRSCGNFVTDLGVGMDFREEEAVSVQERHARGAEI